MRGEPVPLSPREREVAALVAEGLTDRQIATRLFISERTAQGHVLQIRNKLGMDNRAQIASWFTRRTLASAPAPPSGETPRPPAGLAHGLPGYLTSFVGRDRELGDVQRLLQRARLVTVAGPGGCGKTRLAVRAVGEVLHRYPDGAWFIDLSAAMAVPAVLAATFGINERDGGDVLQLVARELTSRCAARCLLILDNCEHVIDGCAAAATLLLEGCSKLSVLCTSRQPLHVTGEAVVKLGSLSLPSPGAASAPDGQRSEAVDLFVDRASLSEPHFALDDANVAAVSEICRQLDGIPLALELAAAQVGLMPIDPLLRQLQRSVARAHRRGVTSRQQTMRAAVDWSYQLLDDAERTLFRRIAVFRGGFSPDAVEAVCMQPAPGRDALAGVEDLQDKSLLVRVPERPDRFRLLEPIRHYALEQLVDSGERDAVRQAHLAYYAALARRGSEELDGPEQAVWLDRLTEDYDNLCAALEFSRDLEHDAGFRLVLSLDRFWWMRGHLTEGRGWFRVVLSRPGPATADRAAALNAAAGLAWLQGDLADARAQLEASLAIRREVGDERGVQSCLANLGVLASTQEDWAAGTDYFEESLTLAQRSSDDNAIGVLLINTGLLAAYLDDHGRAHERLTRAVAMQRTAGNHARLANALDNLGMLALFRRRSEEAAGHYAESLRLHRGLREPQSLAECIEGVAWIAAGSGRHEQALRLGGAADALRREHGAPRRPWSRRIVDEWLHDARARLGGAADSAWTAGAEEGAEEAIDLAIEVCAASSRAMR